MKIITRENAITKMNTSIEWFKIKRYSRTVRWLQFIQKNIEEGNPTDFSSDLKDAIAGYTKDVRDIGGYTEASNKIIQSIYSSLLIKGSLIFRETLSDATPFLQRAIRTHNNLTNMAEISHIPSISTKARYYYYLFGYLIAVEGPYTNWIKILYRLVCESEGISYDSSTIEDFKPNKIQDKLIELDSGYNVLFAGYHRGNLRNAIGHGDFSYDDENNLMHFRHVYRGEIKFDKKLSFKDFHENLMKIMTVMDTGLEMIYLIRLPSFHHLIPSTRT